MEHIIIAGKAKKVFPLIEAIANRWPNMTLKVCQEEQKLCPVCGANYKAWKETFGEAHHCDDDNVTERLNIGL